MTLSRKTRTFFAYNIHEQTLSRVTVMKDVRVMIDSSLRFSHHAGKLINSSWRMLDVASRLTKQGIEKK